jgi:hypothetical protein
MRREAAPQLAHPAEARYVSWMPAACTWPSIGILEASKRAAKAAFDKFFL